MRKIDRCVRWRRLPFAPVAALLSAFAAGCTQLPRAEFDDYRAATSEVASATGEVLSDFQAAYATAEGLGYAGRDLSSPSAGEGGITEAAGADEADVDAAPAAPDAIGIADRGVWEPPQPAAADPAESIVATRRAAIEIVQRSNEVLLALAEGKQAQEFTAEATGLIGALRDFPWSALSESAAKTVASIAPGGGAIIEVVLTALEQAQRERDRRRFIAAVEQGAPLIQGLVELLVQDTANYRNIRYALIEREYTLLAKQSAASKRRLILLMVSAPDEPSTDGLDQDEIKRLTSVAARSIERADAALRKFPELSDGLGLARRPAPEASRLILSAGELEALALAIESDVAAARALETRLLRCDEMLEKYVKLLRAWSGHVRALADAAANAEKTLPATEDLVALATSVRSAINVFENAR